MTDTEYNRTSPAPMTDTEYNRTSPLISNSLHYFSKIYPYVGEFPYICHILISYNS